MRLPEREQLVHLEALDALPQSVKVRMDLTPYPAVHETFKTPPPPKPKPEPSAKVKAIVAEVKRRTETPLLEAHPPTGGALRALGQQGGRHALLGPGPALPHRLPGQQNDPPGPAEFRPAGDGGPPAPGGDAAIFIGQDDGFGIDFDQPDRQKNFRVVYHPEPDPALTLEQIQTLKLPTHVEADLCTPVIREAAFIAEKTVGYMGPGDCRFEALFREAVRAVTREDIGEKNEYQYFDKADRDYFYDQLSTAGHRLLGYPFFTQYDPREPEGPYDTLLFQLDSDMAEDRKDLVLWGDCGVGNFFINREDLLRRDFSRILYNWDCS